MRVRELLARLRLTRAQSSYLRAKRLLRLHRLQRLGEKPAARRTGFGRFLQAMSDVFNHPVLGPVVGPLAAKATGVEARYMKILNSPEELAAARARSYSELADEALGAKTAP